jgi:hypothetical protein
MLRLSATSGATGSEWTRAEIELALTTYFTILVWDLDGTPYSKAEVKSLAARALPARTKKSIENKWCNISFVLAEIDLPRASGLPPRAHIQTELREAVNQWLGQHQATARAVLGVSGG